MQTPALEIDVQQQPNIIWIMADDMGYGDPACYGSGRIPTPHMDRMAAEGVRFTDAHATSAVCSPSRYSVLTGRYNWRSNLKRLLVGGFDQPLIDAGRYTVGRFLKESGYQTAAIGKWHVGMDWPVKRRTDNVRHDWSDPGNIDYTRPIASGPLDVGFDRFFGLAGSANMPPYCFIRDRHTVGIPDQPAVKPDAFVEGFPQGLQVEGWRCQDVDLHHAREAESFIRERDRDRPFFLYLTPSAPHTPWLAPDEFRGVSGLGPRADLVCVVDWMVGRVLETLAEEGIDDNTLVFVTSDNGALEGPEEERAGGHRSNGELRGHKALVYEGGHRVPLLARWPAAVPGGTVCDQTVSLADLFATAAEIVDRPIPSHAAEDSVSFYPLLTGPETAGPVRQHTVQHSVMGRFVLREAQWKLIDACDSGGFGEKQWATPEDGEPAGMLYDLGDDLQETINRWDEQPQRVQAMLARLLEIQDHAAPTPA